VYERALRDDEGLLAGPLAEKLERGTDLTRRSGRLWRAAGWGRRGEGRARDDCVLGHHALLWLLLWLHIPLN
jgi:hypothetical protein